MLEKLNLSDFAENLNSKFTLYADDDNTVDIELIEAVKRKGNQRQDVFSILFLGPNEKPLEQKIYPIEHERLGKFDLFIVPIEQTPTGFIYEAIFNRLRPQ